MYDLAIIGGGINGCGIARDAAGRGLKVLLVERDDLAIGTSSSSTKLIHGGLRYLEHYEFRLVREALSEREVLWGIAPHIIWPLRFILPHHRGLRPRSLIRLGLWLYDHLGGRRKLPASRTVDLRTDIAGRGLQLGIIKAFSYADCWVDDARLVVLNAVDAARRGATIKTRTEAVSAIRDGSNWTLGLRDTRTGKRDEARARVLVNAAGPWVEDVLTRRMGRNAKAHVRLVKGSHIVVPRVFDGDHAYIFQHTDRRVVFAIPYEDAFTLIGTTDVDVTGKGFEAEADPAEIAYLCEVAGTYLRNPVSPADVVWTYSGIRPLYDDGSSASELTRDFVLELDAPDGIAPALSVFGGKITTYRRLAEAALGKLQPWLSAASPSWTAQSSLPGGDFPPDGLDRLADSFEARWPGLPPHLLSRFARTYGTRTAELLGDALVLDDLGRDFGATLTEREARWLIDEEWALTADDILWRRTKLGLHMTNEQRDAFARWLAELTLMPIQPPRL